MLAADDIVVRLAGNQVVLDLDPAGATISDLSTSFAPSSGVLTITAATAGTISTAGVIPGITVNTASDTIAVDLSTITGFNGIAVLGTAGVDSVRIGSGGVNLSVVSGG